MSDYIQSLNCKSLPKTRDQKAKLIFENDGVIKFDEYTYLVQSQSNPNKKYQVTCLDDYSCNCKDFQSRLQGKGRYCKHIKAVLLLENKPRPKTLTPIETIVDVPNLQTCPHCNSTNLIKRGMRNTKLGYKQRFGCKDCNKRFVASPIKYIKGSAKSVCLAMDCYFKGLSYRDISDQFKQFWGLDLHPETIRRWVLKFTKVINEYTKTLTPKTSGVWNADETLVLTKRGKSKKNPNTNFDYVWNVMDNETKFLLASISSGRSRKSKDAQRVFEEAWKQNKEKPKQIIVDCYPGYQSGCRKAFRNWGNERKVKFTSIKGKRNQVNNNAIESHHSQQKEFYKVRRGITKTQDYADGFKTFHNFVRKNVKDNKTPAEKCGIKIEGNRWNTLLLNAMANG